jgi:hypothetical protein
MTHLSTTARTSALVLVVALAGCGGMRNPNAMFSAVRVNPMGPGQFMVSCVDSPGYCAGEANKRCPAGFDVTSNVVNPKDHGRMTMIVRCHAKP